MITAPMDLFNMARVVIPITLAWPPEREAVERRAGSIQLYQARRDREMILNVCSEAYTDDAVARRRAKKEATDE